MVILIRVVVPGAASVRRLIADGLGGASRGGGNVFYILNREILTWVCTFLKTH